MSSRLSTGLCALVLAALPRTSVAQATVYHLGETIKLAPDATLKVVRGSFDLFEKVSVDGTARVFELQVDAEERGGFIALEPFKDPAKSTVFLSVGDKRIAPKAIAKTGGGVLRPNVTAVEDLLPAPRTGRGLWMIALGGRPSVHLLFDIPKDSAGKSMTLSVDVGLDGKPTPINIEIVK